MLLCAAQKPTLASQSQLSPEMWLLCFILFCVMQIGTPPSGGNEGHRVATQKANLAARIQWQIKDVRGRVDLL